MIVRPGLAERVSVDDDDGPAPPANVRSTVFQVGQRLDEATPDHGLGLAIVRDIANLYRGDVSIQEAGFGGAHVTVELPMAQ